MKDGVAIVRCDPDGMVVAVLHEGARVAGFARPGRPLTTLVNPNDFGKALDFIATVRRDGSAYDWEMGLADAAAGAICRFSGGRDGDGMTVAMSPADCHADLLIEELARINSEQATALRRLLKDRAAEGAGIQPYASLTRINNDLITAQRELAKVNATLKAANDLKNRLMGILAHDLRNPLNAIVGFADLLEGDLRGRISRSEMSFITTIRDSSRDMLALVKDTLSMSALESGRMELDRRVVDLGHLAARTVRLLTLMAERKGVVLEFHGPPTPLLVSVDVTKIGQVLNNLIANAIKFSHVGGVVRVTVSRDAAGVVRLTVADQGTGIPEDMKARLFEPFVRGHRQGTAGESSTGLGLFICHSIVTAHGGAIAVTSEVDRGSLFVVTLPAQP